jgi:heptosyltransferase-2
LTSLVVQTAFLGDVVLTTPLLTALAETEGPVDVVTTPGAAPLLETHAAVRRVIPYDKRGADRGWRGLRALARRLRAEHYQSAYLPHRSLRSAALALLARIPRRVGYRDGWRSLYTETRPRPPTGHEIDRLLALAGRGASVETLPSLRLTDADQAGATQWLEAAGIARPFVALAPGSIWGSKRWTRYAELAERLSERTAVVLVGGPGDVEPAQAIVAAVPKAVNACAALTLRQSAALIGKALVLVTNDSAPLHLAQAVGTPTVTIFGPTIPAFGFGPRAPRDQVLGVDGLDCRPCSRHGPARCPLGHHACMQGLGVDDVMRAIGATGALHRRD